ncbi:Nuclear import receptor [Yamadazyma tenuis]|uniref:ARM repeat-containing protein n=1 Tax=Candida tenuis (strain ATCC 10573 / BCRC 21748 / CBS 615 / JCM 9827 / NBRC 10315 / NRRL Y-1498 / VKM Y-70) TaxID=590646 RepID=G3AZ01_CANTC|nr:ARM repeat-containing protein [Yamadazyma tenuis ATCC 10573]EGV65972.1 ARM repeat-containing protein [Yamadazyma tenuis ATCC 10573]WEJ95691.1 Nuclear import receptor [Yamadazyma tenuis]
MFEISDVVSALGTMYSNADRELKRQAMEFLENFQKSKESWQVCNEYLMGNDDTDIQTKLFLTQTLRNKLTYDLEQVNEENLGQLRDVVLNLLVKYNNNSSYKLIRIQLNICLCQLMLQDLSWTNPLNSLVEFFVNNKLVDNLFEFLKILPEEINDINKTYLTDEEFEQRTNSIMNESNIEQVFLLFDSFVEGHELLILDCLVNWIKESPIESFLKINSLTNLIFNSISNEDYFEKSIDCLVVIIRETRDIDNLDLIRALLMKLIELNKFIKVDEENFEILAKLYVESCESWHVLVAKNPDEFKPLVEILLGFLREDHDLNIIHYSFYFWYLLKQLLTIPTFKNCRIIFVPIYEELIRIILVKLTYPDDDNFGGDKEQEDKFKEFRYEMGDVLKDATVIVGSHKALSIPFERIKAFSNSSNLKWQNLESALFSMRSMAKEIPKTENILLPQIMNYLINLPEHPKIRYSATLVLGRYTEWTSANPEFLEIQLNYIIKGFDKQNASSLNPKDYKSILISSTNALMYFCQDCSKLLINYLEQLYLVYNEINGKIDFESNIELIEGIGYILRNFKENDPKLYDTIMLFLQPILNKLDELYESNNADLIGQKFELLAALFKILKVKDYEIYENKTVGAFVGVVLPIVNKYLFKYLNNLTINEKIMKLIKVSVESFNIYLLDNLKDIITLLIEGFKVNNFGCYLYVSGTILKVFGDEEAFEPDLINTVCKFGVEQANYFFTSLSSAKNISGIPDVIEDFFRMLDDFLMYYPNQFFDLHDSAVLNPSIESSMVLIDSLENFESVISIVHYLIDLISFGSSNLPISFVDIRDEALIKFKVSSVLESKGEQILYKLIHSLIFRFNNTNNDTIIYDMNELILKVIILGPPNLVVNWLMNIFSSLPNNDVKQLNKFNSIVEVAVENKDQKRIRNSLKDYIDWYTRKNVKRTII